MTADRTRAALAAALITACVLLPCAPAGADPTPAPPSPAASPATSATAPASSEPLVPAATAPPAPLVPNAPMSDNALLLTLHSDLDSYLKLHKFSEHVSAASLTISLKGSPNFIDLAAGTMEYGGHEPVPARSLWQIGSNTKSFTAATLLQLEAAHALSLDDTVGKWLPQYPAWKSITIRRLLNMTSGIPSYDDTQAFQTAVAGAPKAAITTERLIDYARGLPMQKGYYYSNTGYLLAQVIAEKAGHDTFANQLRKRFFEPLALGDISYAASFTPAAVQARMPAGYYFDPSQKAMTPLLGKDARPWTVSWMQGAGGIVASTEALTKWVRALYDGRVLAPAQQDELLSVVSMTSGKAIATTTPADPRGFGLGVAQADVPGTGKVWFYEGGTFGYRMLYMYVPKSGAIVTIGLNSATEKDDIGHLFTLIYSRLQQAGRV